jgi:predicted dehydrogenase
LRFHPVIDAIKKFLNNKKINQVSVYNSSYLPDWRPEQDHRKSYSAHKKMGGGVILDLSHEFDFIDYLFGPIQAIEGTVAKKSNVTHDAEDLVDAIIQTKRAPVNLHLDIFSRGQAERSIYVDFEGGFIRGDLIENKIEGSNKGKKFHRAYKISRDYTYRKQLKYFLYHRNNPAMMNNLAEASQLFRKIIKFREQK